MSEEEFKKLCDNLDKRIVLHQTIKEPISQDLDNLIKLSVAYEKLQQENQALKKQLELGEEQYNDLVEEKEKLQEQLSSINLELEELRKQLEENKLNHKQLKDLEMTQLLNSYQTEKLIKLENQQKQFIEYLINLSNWYSADGVKQGMVNEILSKYKEIIGYKKGCVK